MQISNKMSENKISVLFLSACHIINDSYMNLFPPLLPFIMPALGLKISAVGWLMTFFSVTSSVSQIIIGYLTDRIGGRFFIIAGPLIAAIFMSLIGTVNSYILLALAISVSGLGVASFHPPASVLAGSISKDKSGRSMSIFTLGGNIGWSIMPLLAVPLVENFGLKYTIFLVIPGIIASILLASKIDKNHIKINHEYAPISISFRKKPFATFSLLGTVAFRSLAFFGLVTFLPKYLGDIGFSPLKSGMILSALTFSGALGGLLGGFVSDFVGRKTVIVSSLILSVPMLNLALLSNGNFKALWFGFSGALLLASFSVTVVAAQEIFPDNKGIASSLALGFGLGLGGLGVGIIGNIASVIGLDKTMFLTAFFPLIASLFALNLPKPNQNNHSKVANRFMD